MGLGSGVDALGTCIQLGLLQYTSRCGVFLIFQYDDCGPLERIVPAPEHPCLLEVGCSELLRVELIETAVRVPAAIGSSDGLRAFWSRPVKSFGWAC
jgi:hypothetical protein